MVGRGGWNLLLPHLVGIDPFPLEVAGALGAVVSCVRALREGSIGRPPWALSDLCIFATGPDPSLSVKSVPRLASREITPSKTFDVQLPIRRNAGFEFGVLVAQRAISALALARCHRLDAGKK